MSAPDDPIPAKDREAILRLGLEDEADDPERTVPVAPPGTGGGTRRTGSARHAWEPPTVEELQRALPQYEITQLIARGGMGAVYRGTQKTLKRAVAIKVLPPEIEDADLQFAARFKHEAQAMAQLSHPNIVAVYDAGEVYSSPLAPREEHSALAGGERTPSPGEVPADGSAKLISQERDGYRTPPLLYFVMEFIEGTDVAQLIASEGRLEAARAAPIIAAVCEALAFAHEEGIIHRDIKPSNIMIDKKGRVKVADFGLAKTVNVEGTLMTGSHMAMGTPDFIAPEALIPGMKVDGRADLYAVGVMLYQMLTGAIPRGRFELPSGVVPQVDKGFDAIVDRAMQTDREKRYSTALEMKAEVERISRFVPSSVPDTSAQRTNLEIRSTPSRRQPLLLGTAAAIILGTAAWFLMDEPTEAESGPLNRSEAEIASQRLPEGRAERGNPLSGTIVANAPGTAQGTVRTTLSTSTEPWVNALTSEAKLANQPSDLTPEGLRFTGTRMIKHERAPKRDGALRMQTRFVPATPGPQLRVRNAVDDAQFYALNIGSDGRAAFLKRLSKAAGGSPTLGEFPLPKPLGGGDAYELELRVVGSQFTVKFSGQVLGQAEDTVIAEGRFGIATASPEPVLVTALEYLHLSGPQESGPLSPLSGTSGANAPGTAQGTVRTTLVPSALPQWRKAITRYEDLSADVRAKGTLRWNDGWIEPTSPTQSPGIVLLPGPKVRNGGIRMKGRWSPEIKVPALGNVFLRRMPAADAGDQFYRASPTGPPVITLGLVLANSTTKTQEDLARAALLRPLSPGDEYELELIAIGDQLHTRLNDQRLPVVTDTRLKEGSLGFHAVHPMRDVEVIHLDGLSEAEARKAVGIDPVSPSPGPPVSKSSPFPPGQWVKVLTKPEDLPEKMRASAQFQWNEGWISPSTANSPGVNIPSFYGKNRGIRLHGRKTADPNFLVCTIWVRKERVSGGANDAYRLTLSGTPTSVSLNFWDEASKQPETFHSLRPDPPLVAGVEYDLELYAIGDQLIARYNGKQFPIGTDTRLTEGEVGLQIKHEARDVEVINLDGLSEAEARKLVGIGE